MLYGEHGRIGLICPGISPSTEMDFHRYAPAGVAVTTARIPYREVTLDGLQEMSDQVSDTAALFKGFPMQLIAFACTTGSMVGGPGYDKTLISKMEAVCGLPSITTTTALLDAFEALSVRNVAIVTPYSDALNEMEVRFLESAGIHSTFIKGLGHTDTRVIPFTKPEEMLELARGLDIGGADALFISCTALCVLDIILPLEKELGIPVVTSNQVTLWSALRKIGAQAVPGLGQLFDS